MQTLTIIIVSWNVCDLLRRCLQTVVTSLSASDIDYRVIVVDNASSDGTVAMLQAEFPHVLVRIPDRNLGFAAGTNLALRVSGFVTDQAFMRQQLPDQQISLASSRFVLLLNPDTEIVDAALVQLIRYLEQHPTVIAVGPQLRFADGSVQSSRRRFPTRITFFWESTLLERLWPANPWACAYHCKDKPDTVVQPVDWLVGAALLVRGAAIMRGGLLDEGFFLYSEELEWQYRLQRSVPTSAGIVYLPDAVVIHHEGKSSEQVLPGRHIHFQRSKLRLARQWYGSLFAAILRCFLLLCYTWDLASEMAKYLLGHRRDLRRQRIQVYLTVLHNGLGYTGERSNTA